MGVGRDYADWHRHYDEPGSPLHLRLLVVQDMVARELDAARPGPVSFVSMCAGEGRDVITVAQRHRRGTDLHGLLVELDARNARSARARIDAAGLHSMHVLDGDAGMSDAYERAVPADLVLACGIFGNITDEAVEHTIRFLPRLCAPGATVIWTRFPEPVGIIDRINAWFASAGFVSEALVIPDPPMFAVGASRLRTDPLPFESGVRLFSFVR